MSSLASPSRSLSAGCCPRGHGEALVGSPGDDSSHMVTVCPFTSSNTMKRSFPPLYAPEVFPLLTWNRGRSIHPGARSPIQQGRHEAPQTHLMFDEHDVDPRREIFSRNPILSVVPEPESAHSSPSPPHFRFPIFRRRERLALACCSDLRPERPQVRIPVRRPRSRRPNRYLLP